MFAHEKIHPDVPKSDDFSSYSGAVVKTTFPAFDFELGDLPAGYYLWQDVPSRISDFDRLDVTLYSRTSNGHSLKVVEWSHHDGYSSVVPQSHET